MDFCWTTGVCVRFASISTALQVIWGGAASMPTALRDHSDWLKPTCRIVRMRLDLSFEVVQKGRFVCKSHDMIYLKRNSACCSGEIAC